MGGKARKRMKTGSNLPSDSITVTPLKSADQKQMEEFLRVSSEEEESTLEFADVSGGGESDLVETVHKERLRDSQHRVERGMLGYNHLYLADEYYPPPE